ncbi:hypothetical protein C9374_010316 [Naegleria lovaniensis]|uniref:Tryptophan 2,3-dioxygenase n=1 Tax=Naegleria lovaniensis TaxID=51637 RepID=A0AA88GC86_NAELO|nr:uncharacterized protein C9374_010316 [Naegleria lovaniensis]KAG2374942.1 hypothetical protein C9374_010316 [Naegleria lovaniensis]
MDTHTHPVSPLFLNESAASSQLPSNGSKSTTNQNSNAYFDEERSQSKAVSYEELHGIKPVDMDKKIQVTYNNYIMTDSLLTLQGADCKGGLTHHDEHLFIVVHQSFELWFNQILFEVESIQNILKKVFNYAKEHPNEDVDLTVENTQILVHRLERADQILRYSLGTFDILETMHPADFLEFRSVIGPASGFQSVQMRELEVMMGLRDSNRRMCGGRTSYETDLQHDIFGLTRLKKRQQEMSIRKLVYRWLEEIVYPKIPGTEFISTFLERKRENLAFQKSRWFNPETEMAIIEQHIEKEMKPARQWITIEDQDFHVKQRTAFKVNSSGARSSGGCPFFSQQQSSMMDGETKQETCPVTSQSNGSENIVPPKRSNEEKIERIKKRRAAILFIMSYRHHYMLFNYANLLDRLVALEESLLMWRTRHVRMVERMIGTRTGTGGSSGVDYLEGTLKYRVFLDLWESRSHFIQTTALPKIQYKSDINQFVFEK